MANVDLNDVITNLRTIIDQTTTVLQTRANLTPTEQARLQGINTSANASLIQLMDLQSSRNTQVGNTYTQATQASIFVNEAADLIRSMFEEETINLNDLKILNSTQMKQIQFNNYFSQKYNYNVGIMKVLVIASILLMICILLHTRNLIPDFLYTIILAIIISISIIIVVTMMISEYRRTNTNFNEFRWSTPST